MTAGRNNSDSVSKHWGTPHKYVEAVRKAFGGTIHLDPCSNEWSIVKARVEWRLPENDGLRKEWSFPTIYVNPPYGADRERGTKISDWLKKCARAFHENGSEVIALVPVAANTLHWKESVWARATSICFLYDTRVRFLENGRDRGKGSPMANAVVYWGAKPDRFANAFAVHGAVISLADVRLPTGRLARHQLSLVLNNEKRTG